MHYLTACTLDGIKERIYLMQIFFENVYADRRIALCKIKLQKGNNAIIK